MEDNQTIYNLKKEKRKEVRDKMLILLTNLEKQKKLNQELWLKHIEDMIETIKRFAVYSPQYKSKNINYGQFKKNRAIFIARLEELDKLIKK